MQPNAQYIDGSWYENEYQGKWYRENYIEKPEPDWAKQANDYYIGLKILYTGIKPKHKILDLGSSVGRYMEAWQRLGYNKIKGIEISQTACLHHNSGCEIYQGSVQDMHMFKDKQFDLVQSAAFFEHIDESIIERSIRECFRVGKMQAHTIGLHKGTDPSHINVKSLYEWQRYFEYCADEEKYLIGVLPDPLFEEVPILVCIHENDLTYPVIEAYKKAEIAENEKKVDEDVVRVKHPLITKKDVAVELSSRDDFILNDSVKYMSEYKGRHKTMIEIGAHVGCGTLYYAVEKGFEKILAIEANLINYKLLVSNIFKNGLEDIITPMWAAVALESGQFRKLYFDGVNNGQCGLFLDKGVSCGYVQTISFEHILSLFNEIDVLKIDIEGSEYEILSPRSNLKEQLKKVRFLELETHTPAPKHFDDNIFEAYGFPHQESANDILKKFLSECGFDFSYRGETEGGMQGYNKNFKGKK